MLELLEFYVSGFWTWMGLTMGLSLVVYGAVSTAAILFGRRRGEGE